MEFKRCSSKFHEGQNPLPVSEFYKNRSTKIGLNNNCRKCSKILREKFYKEHYDSVAKTQKKARANFIKKYPEREAEIQAKSRTKKLYNLTLEEVERMYLDQSGLCKICNVPVQRRGNGNLKSANIDHNHLTGKVRGLLCYKCNHGIGNFKDDINLLQSAIKYLQIQKF